ncbi:transmembrane protein, partial [Trichonephila clavata]
FWKKTDIYREQPDVSFKHQMVLVLETESPDQLIFWSTYEQLNQLMDHKFLQISLQLNIEKKIITKMEKR